MARTYLRCETCELVFVPPAFHLSRAEERALYEQHQNDPNDPRYRAFLSRLFTPLRALLLEGAEGLDFGCGPGPTLSKMFRESGLACEEYDPIFSDDRALLSRTWDFVTCTEVLEHLAQPAVVIEQLVSLVRPGAWLGVMTKRVTTEEAFASWHYTRDPSHVAFFADATLAWIARKHDLSMRLESSDVALFQRI
jgi:2-polyprenyl-3-methyl-5-hydroxy-6-metoxy-1,4-benzoquinol methylase